MKRTRDERRARRRQVAAAVKSMNRVPAESDRHKQTRVAVRHELREAEKEWIRAVKGKASESVEG